MRIGPAPTRNAQRAETIHLALLLATLGTLLTEALFIFAPLVRELSSKEETLHAKQYELAYNACHDQLTGLGNRRQLRRRVASLCQPATGQFIAPSSLVSVDLDNLKAVNDSNGHEARDRLLRLVADLIKSHIRPDDAAFRLGGDEFLISVASGESGIVGDIAERLRTGIETLMTRQPGCIGVAASFGIACAPAHGSSFEELLSNADIAVYHAKATGKNTVAMFHDSLRVSFETRRDSEAFIRNALDASAFEPFFQPQVDMRSRRIIGVEALARCYDADRTIVPPNRFLPVAEETGLIVPLGEQIIGKAIRRCAAYLTDGVDFGKLSVNASSAQLRDPGFVAFIASTLAETGFPAERLSIEILETVLFDDDDTVVAIRNRGVSVELDDFGTGYTSIANVNRLKVNRVKIDRSFIASVGADASSMHVLKAILTMAESLDVDLIAEGIETDFQQEQLIALGCSSGQGFRFAKPMNEHDLQAWLCEVQRLTAGRMDSEFDSSLSFPEGAVFG